VINSPFEQFEEVFFNSKCLISIGNLSYGEVFLFIVITLVYCCTSNYLLVREVPFFMNGLYDFIYTSIITENQYTAIKLNIKSFIELPNITFDIFALLFFILYLSFLGAIPYNITIPAQTVISLGLSFYFFYGYNIKVISIEKLRFFSLFFPKGISWSLVVYLTPIETLSYFFRGISLGVRLFANLTAGHVLLKVLLSFCWAFLVSTSAINNIIGFFMFVANGIIVFVETIMPLIQTYVFITLLAFYFREAVSNLYT
jgi:ATP synthase subunit 6